MGDDRILFLPPQWAPDPDVLSTWPAVGTLLRRLRGHWPLDFVRWPSVKGELWLAADPVEAIQKSLGSVMTPVHHVVRYGFGERNVQVLAASPPRSLAVTSFFTTRETMAAAGEATAFDALRAAAQATRKPAWILPALFQGADPEYVSSLVEKVEATRDQEFLDVIYGRSGHEKLPTATVEVPALYLASAMPLPGRQAMENVFRRFFPNTRTDELELWGVKMHEEAAGHEFADKVIPFIQKVIAGRETRAQT